MVNISKCYLLIYLFTNLLIKPSFFVYFLFGLFVPLLANFIKSCVTILFCGMVYPSIDSYIYYVFLSIATVFIYISKVGFLFGLSLSLVFFFGIALYILSTIISVLTINAKEYPESNMRVSTLSDWFIYGFCKFFDSINGFSALVGNGLGIWLRTLFIRFFSTVFFMPYGLRCLTRNWYEVLWSIDIMHSPELLPGSKKINSFFSVSGIMNEFNSKTKNSKYYIFVAIIWYVPAIIWRWALKSTLWIWWPLAFLLHPPFYEKSIMEVRDLTSLRIFGLGKWLPSVSIIIMLWLGTAFYSVEELKFLAEIFGDTTFKLFDKILNINTPPVNSLRYVMLYCCCIITIIMYWRSNSLKILHKQILEEETIINEIGSLRKNMFLMRAKKLELVHKLRVVCFVLLGYSYILYFSYQWYPEKSINFISHWLLVLA